MLPRGGDDENGGFIGEVFRFVIEWVDDVGGNSGGGETAREVAGEGFRRAGLRGEEDFYGFGGFRVCCEVNGGSPAAVEAVFIEEEGGGEGEKRCEGETGGDGGRGYYGHFEFMGRNDLGFKFCLRFMPNVVMVYT